MYPNVYIMFLADSAEYRKGEPIKAARKLLNLTKVTKVFSGTASIQSILDLLSQDIANKGTGVPIKGGAALITADELASFFVSDPRLIPLLTDMWDPRIDEDYDYNLRGGSIKVKNLCLSMLAASNETFLREVYDTRAVYGGLLGRTYMVKPDETRPPNSLMYQDLDAYELKPLLESLWKIAQLKGAVIVTDAAKTVYDEWYKDLYKRYKTHPDRTGVLQRMHTNVLKLAIIIAASKYSLNVTEEIFTDAIIEVSSLKQNYELYIMSSGKATQAEIGTKFLAAMLEKENLTIARKEFLANNWADVTSEDFDKLIETLRQAEMIHITLNGNDIAYKMTEKCVNIVHKRS